MAASPKTRKKLEATARPEPADGAGDLEVIIKVREANYVPAGVAIRAQISDKIFTSVIQSETLQSLEDDPQVQSVAVSRKLRDIG
jgi:hypothetical protein